LALKLAQVRRRISGPLPNVVSSNLAGICSPFRFQNPFALNCLFVLSIFIASQGQSDAIDDRFGGKGVKDADCLPFIVEDDRDFRFILLRAFEKAGIPKGRIRIAADGEQAIASFGPQSPSGEPGAAPSFVILDINLPKYSGFEVLSWIRESSSFPQVPVFMLTSSDDPDDVARAYDLGTDGYFVKPLEYSDLGGIISAMLGHWATREHRRVPGSLADPRQTRP
jgi:CheY-like chemotaxis protein